MAVLDLYGRPMAPTPVSELMERQAIAQIGSVRQIQSGHPADGLTPVRLASILRAAESGDMTAYLELAEQMEEKDLHYAGVLGVRKRAIRKMEMRVSPGDTTSAAMDAAEMLREDLQSAAVRTSLIDVMDAVGKGFSVSEICWRREGRRLRIDGLEWVDPRWFEFDSVNGTYLRLRDAAGAIPLRRDGYLIHMVKAKSGLPIRGGIARLAVWGYLFKNYTLKDWQIFMEAYGHPLRLGKYGPSATAVDRSTLLRAVRQIGVDMAAIIPKEMEVEVIPGNVTGSDRMYEASARWWDEQISKGVLGQVGTTDAMSGGYALGKVHDEVRDDLAEADGEQLGASMSRDIAGAVTRLNFAPGVAAPIIEFLPPETIDQKMWLDLIERGPAAGLKIAVAQVRDVFGVRAPEPDEELLMPPRDIQPPSAPPMIDPTMTDTTRQAASQTVPVPVPFVDAIDSLVEELIASGEMQRAADGEFGALIEAISAAKDWDELRDIMAAFEADAPGPVATLLERATYAARLAGAVGAPIRDA